MTTKRRTIIRAERHDQPYFMLARSVAQNPDLSYEALGLLTYLLSKPGDWVVQPETLMRVKCGRDKVYRLLRELIGAGHVEKRAHRGEHQRLAGIEYIVYEIPRTVSPLPEKPYTVNPYTEKPDTENKHITDKREEQSKERESTPLPADGDGIPDHVAPNMRRVATGKEPQPATPDGNATAYQIAERYCDAWSINVDRYRKAVHRDQGRYAEALAAMGAMPEDVFAMCQAKRKAGREPYDYGLRLVQLDFPGWKSRQENTPQLTVIKLTPEQLAAEEAQREADQRQWWKENGLA